MINYSSPIEIDRLLDEHGLAAQKRFGQNFLISHPARERLIECALKGSPSEAWEIGPGIGTMTTELDGRCDRLTVFEIDLGFVSLLKELFDGRPVQIVSGDFLETWREVCNRDGAPDVLVGNLPYNAAARILLDLFEHRFPSRLVITVQREAAVRMSASHHSSEYSSFSAICQIGWRIRTIGTLQPGSFYPKPRIVSTMLELTFTGAELPVSRSFLLDACRCLFQARRKTIRNNLRRCGLLGSVSPSDIDRLLAECEVGPDQRAEELSPERIVELVAQMHRAIL